jgi:diguanylate cyclase
LFRTNKTIMINQIFNMVNIGLIILDKDLNVVKWNRWMKMHSQIDEEDILGVSIFKRFPQLDNAWFQRSCKSIFAFGNFVICSQKIHKYLFPLKPVGSYSDSFEFMQQNCTIGPLRDENNKITHLFITVQDVTDIATYQNKLIEMSTRDGLTKAFNRRHFSTVLDQEVDRHKRYNRPMSVIMMDLDFFKKINDTYGHLTGDFVLQEFARVIQSSIRRADIFARYGGEEFCLILPETGLNAALVLALHAHERIEQHAFVFGGQELHVTFSAGIAEMSAATPDAQTLLKKVDEALYEAKSTGRNKIVGN